MQQHRNNKNNIKDDDQSFRIRNFAFRIRSLAVRSHSLAGGGRQGPGGGGNFSFQPTVDNAQTCIDIV